MKLHHAKFLLGTYVGVVSATNSYMIEAMNGERVSGYAKHDNEPSWKPKFTDESGPYKGIRITRENWSLSCSSAQQAHACNNIIDGENTTSWHSDIGYGGHSITVDMKELYTLNSVVILPPLNTEKGGLITQHEIFVSNDGQNWGDPIAYGRWPDANRQRMAVFEPISARYMKLETKGGSKKASIGISELNAYATQYTVPQDPTRGVWGPTLDFPIVPVSGAQEPSGEIVLWSSWGSDEFHSSPGGLTVTSRLNPLKNEISKRDVTDNKHDMFCTGISMDGTGMIVVTGGNDASQTSLYNSSTEKWSKAKVMNTARGYHSSTTLSDGRVFLIGGGFSGGANFEKNGEVYNPWDGNWTALPNAKVKPMLTGDRLGMYRSDNHAWLFGWKNESIFQAGPSSAMNWYHVEGQGRYEEAGLRAHDSASMSGNAVMFDAVKGKILTFGGSVNYDKSEAKPNAYIITLGDVDDYPEVTPAGKNGQMHYKRVFHTSVVLPDGKVFISGGQSLGVPFNEENAHLVPEIYDPETDTFIKMQQNNVVRVYHSLSLLLPDGRVLNGGGGLCARCAANHYDAQIFTPPYLLTKNGKPRPRPQVLSELPKEVSVGAVIPFATRNEIKTASLIRLGSATHTVNTDQRRVPLDITCTFLGTQYVEYEVKLPTDPGILIPGYWMLFVMDNEGVPSISETIMITAAGKTPDPPKQLNGGGHRDDKYISSKFRMELIK